MEFQRTKLLLWIFAVLAVFIIGGTAAVVFVLPEYIETRLVPRLTDTLGLKAASVKVRRIGLWGIDLGPVRFHGQGGPVLSAGAIFIDYCPGSLIHGDIVGITLVGPRIELAATADGLIIPGLTLPVADDEKTKAAGPIDLQALIPIKMQWLRIERAEVTLRAGHRRLLIPLDAQIDTIHLDQGRIAGQVEASILGNPVSINATVDQQRNEASIALSSRGTVLESLVQAGLGPRQAQLTGRADIEAEGHFSIDPPAARRFSCTVDLRDTWIQAYGAVIENMADGTHGLNSIAVTIQSHTPGKIQWSCAPFQLTGAAKMDVTNLAGTWRLSEAQWQMDADITSLIAPQTIFPNTRLTRDLPINGHLQARGSADSDITFTGSASGSREMALTIHPAEVKAAVPRLSISGRLTRGVLDAEAECNAGQITIAAADMQARMQDLTVNGSITLQPPDSEKASQIKILGALSGMRATRESAAVTIPMLNADAIGRRTPGKPWHFKGFLKTTRAVVADPQHQWALNRISLAMPLEWPPPAGGKKGRLTIGNVQWDQRDIGGIQGKLWQTDDGVDLDLRHDSKLFPGMIVLVHGGMDNNRSQVEVRIPPYETEEVDLGRFFPDAAGILGKGLLSASLQATVKSDGPSASGQLLLEQASLRQEALQLSLDGIRLDMRMDDLMTLKSAPKQKLQIAALQFGKLSAQTLEMDFQLERRQTLFIEKAGVNWCKGRINTAAIRIAPGVEDYDVTLFCDRLNLAMVLDQLGAAEASGEGTVNGRIPVRWNRGKLSFDNGFLYSTPGQPGAIQLSGTEVLLSGLPPGTPQHTQLDIATEALKDYTYQWAKLSVSSDQDNLLLALKFDGKPNRLLPFAYDQSLGQFTRIAGQGQADFQGISIDLNFTSPLNDIIHYKELLRQN